MDHSGESVIPHSHSGVRKAAEVFPAEYLPAENLLDAQKQSLEMVVKGAPLKYVLTYLARVVEQQADGRALAAILLLDEEGSLRNGAAPSLPEYYVKALDGVKPDPNLGTCAAAAALSSIVITPDIAVDPKWRTLKHLPLKLGLRAAWSVPIMAGDGQVLGTFGTYFRECRTPSCLERQAVEVLARTAALAIERKLAEQLMTQNEQQWRAIFNASRDGILVEQKEQIVYVNDSYASLLGYQKSKELVGTHISAIVSREDEERMLGFGRRRLNGEDVPARYEFKGKRKDGTLLDLEASVSTPRVDNKIFIVTTVRDISERKRAELALRESENKYRLLMEQASDGIQTYDWSGNLIEINSKLCDMLGYTREEMLRLNVKDFMLEVDIVEFPIRFEQLRAGRTLLSELLLRRKDGTLLPVEISGRMIQNGVLLSIIRDITDRKRAEEKLRHANDQLERRVSERTSEIAAANEMLRVEMAGRLCAEKSRQELMDRQVLAQEEERRALSRELHDQMGQKLIAMMMGLKSLSASQEEQSVLSNLLELQGLTDELANEVRTLAWGLRPPGLDDLGLETALYNYVEEWAELNRIPVDFHSSGFERDRLPITHETAIYRIAQEALTNISKHSGANRVSFILKRRPKYVLAVVEDNGVGFDISVPNAANRNDPGLGLLGMRERTALLDGTLTIESVESIGTSVFVRLPLNKTAVAN